ncbi:MAG: cob(I)yrinic acid a,c-diamide adenosyltransferase [Bacteroidota bacterium]
MAFKIYTKTGDKGETSLFGGTRLPKNHIRIEAYGTVDELNAYVGMLRDVIVLESVKTILKEIQDRLFTIGANLASDPSKEMQVPDLTISDIELLEKSIDAMEKELAPLKHFVLPGGHTTVSFCHIARCVCRRAERMVITLQQTSVVETIIIQYLNRLSDYLFVLGRYQAKTIGVEEIKWEARKA